MKVRILAAAAAAVIGFAAAGSAQAALVTMRYAGQINYVASPLDPFGVADVNGDLFPTVGYSFDVTFDTSIPTLYSAGGTRLLQGTQVDPVVTTWSLTINGITDTGAHGPGEFLNNQIGRFGGPASGQISAGFDGGLFNVDYWGVTIGAASTAANSPEFPDVFVEQNVTGGARFIHYSQTNGVFTHLYELRGNVTSATVLQPQAAPGVPEPASWALMIGGFGGAGAVLRRRRSARPA